MTKQGSNNCPHYVNGHEMVSLNGARRSREMLESGLMAQFSTFLLFILLAGKVGWGLLGMSLEQIPLDTECLRLGVFLVNGHFCST